MTPTQQVTVLHDFTGGSDGSGPIERLVQASDGYLYGTTYDGGTSGLGVLFRISTTGKFTVLHNFEQSAGSNPVALIQHTNGFLYGDTFSGGLKRPAACSIASIWACLRSLPICPAYGRVGMPVDILGEGFTTYSQVFFNGVRAQIITVSAHLYESGRAPRRHQRLDYRNDDQGNTQEQQEISGSALDLVRP